MAQFSTISAAGLMRLIATPAAPVIIDVRIDEDVDAHPYLIPTARRRPFREMAVLAETLRDTNVVVVCHKGLKLSHGAAAVLRANGVRAEVLEGGSVEWRAKRLPALPIAHSNATGKPSLWVTKHRPKIDRIACPWLIRRFVDPQAQFLFVPPRDVFDIAEKFDAIPFDMPGAPWTHQEDKCTFDAMVSGFGLSTDPLERMATVIRGADTNRHDLAPECAGLLAVSVGLSRAHSDDMSQLEDGMALYDALYRWARDGQGEGHDWREDSV